MSGNTRPFTDSFANSSLKTIVSVTGAPAARYRFAADAPTVPRTTSSPVYDGSSYASIINRIQFPNILTPFRRAARLITR